MYRKILLGGVTAAVILGAGGTALALSTGTSPSPSPTSSSAGGKHDGKHGRHGKGRLLRHLDHGQFTTTGKDGKTETHDLISGAVTSVSSSSITVRAADAKSETYAVDKDTKVRERTAGRKGSDGTKTKGSKTDATIADIAKGDHVIVLGTGATKYVAKHIVEIK